MKKITKTKLVLNRETIRSLDAQVLQLVAGGLGICTNACGPCTNAASGCGSKGLGEL